MTGKLVRSSVGWFFYSVIVGLVHLWVAVMITVWAGAPALQQTLADGSLLVVAIVLVATSYGTNYDRILRKYSDWPPLIARIVAAAILLPALVFYVLTVFPTFLGLDIPSPSWTPILAGSFVLAGAVYGLTCHIFAWPADRPEGQEQ